MALDLCQLHCQVLLITCQRFTKKNANHTWKEKKIVSECRYISFMNNRLHYKCKECNDKSYKSINGLIKNFPNTYRFCNGDVNKFVLLPRKSVYP